MGANALYLLATRYGPLSVAVTLSSLYPASTVILARIVLGERLNGWQVTGVACAVLAVALIVGRDDTGECTPMEFYEYGAIGECLITPLDWLRIDEHQVWGRNTNEIHSQG